MSTLGCFDAYIRKVFDWTGMGSHLEDGRTHPRIPMAKIVEGLLMGMVFRSPAISEIEWECREGVLKERIGAISDDSFGYGLEHLGPASLQEGWTRMARLMKRKGMLREGRYKPYVVGVLDGIETLASYSRSCDRCLRREIVGGDTPRIQYYHRSVVVCLVGYTFPIPIGMEMMRPGENEVACGERLLIRLVAGLGRRFLDIVVGDALYCTPAFFSTCRALGIAPVSVLKENQPELLREAAWQKKRAFPSLRPGFAEGKDAGVGFARSAVGHRRSGRAGDLGGGHGTGRPREGKKARSPQGGKKAHLCLVQNPRYYFPCHGLRSGQGSLAN